MLDLGPKPGWVGIFSRGQAPGCYPNETRVEKIATEPGDAHPIGAQARVLGSIYHPTVGAGYFVEWDSRPRHAVFVVDWKLKALG